MRYLLLLFIPLPSSSFLELFTRVVPNADPGGGGGLQASVHQRSEGEYAVEPFLQGMFYYGWINEFFLDGRGREKCS